MKWKWKKIGSLILPVWLLTVTVALASRVQITAQVTPKVIGLSDEVKYVLTVSSSDTGSMPNPHLPSFDNFNVINSYQSSSYNLINGRFSLSKVYKFVLLPKAAGTFIIRPATIAFNGKTFSSDSVAVVVEKRGTLIKSKPGIPAYRGTARRKVDNTVQGNMDVKTTVDKKEAYPGEPILLTFAFYRRIRLFSSPEYSAPDTTGFWQEELSNTASDTTRYINNRQYRVKEFKYILYPLASGKHEIGAASLLVPMGFFSSPRRFETLPIEINVLPLPEKGRPPGFNGAVGDFRISASVDKQKVPVGDPINLEIRIKGTGNIKNVQGLVFSDLEGWKKFDSKVTENISKGKDDLYGEKFYEFVLVPQKVDVIKVPSVSFSFFDYKQRKYRTIKTKSFPVKIVKGKKPAFSVMEGGTAREKEISILSSDIRFIKPDKEFLEKEVGSWYHSPLFVWWHLLPLGLFAGALVYKKRKADFDVKGSRCRRAYRTAVKTLTTMEKSPARPAEFYGAVSKALYGYIGDKFDLSSTGLTTDEVSRLLTPKSDRESVRMFIRLLEDCDFARFATAQTDGEKMERFFKEAHSALERLDKVL